MACDSTFLYVADTRNHRVQKLRLASGAHVGTVGREDCAFGDGEGEFARPTRLCVANGELYVCDCNNSRIVVLNTDLKWQYAFGDPYGPQLGRFAFPTAVAAHGSELYVVDHGNDRVQTRPPAPCPPRAQGRHAPPRLARQVFTQDPRPNTAEEPARHGRMRFARAFGGELPREFGIEARAFNFPEGVAVVRGLLVVSKYGSVRVLTREGVPLQEVQFPGARPPPDLAGLCVVNERVWVADKWAATLRALKVRTPAPAPPAPMHARMQARCRWRWRWQGSL